MLAGNGLVNIALSLATSCSALWVFFTPFGRRKPYGPNSPIHTSLCVTSFLQIMSPAYPRPIALFHRYYLFYIGWKRLSKYSLVIGNFLFCPVGFLPPFGRRKPYGPNSPIHTLSCVASLLRKWFTGDPRAICSYVNLLNKNIKRDTFRCLLLFS